MPILRIILLVLFIAWPTGNPLSSTVLALDAYPKEGAVDKVDVQLNVQGQLKFRGEKGIQRQPLRVQAHLTYLERFDSVPNSGRVFVADSSKKLRVTRKYSQADVTITVAGTPVRPKLAPAHQVLVAELSRRQLSIFSPGEPLTRPELDLVDIQLPSTVLNELLPIQPIKAGQKWRPIENILAAVLRVDGITKSSVEAVAQSTSRIVIKGSVSAAVQGVSADIDLEGELRIDPRQQRVVEMRLKMKEDRAIGHAGPGLEVEANIHVQIAPATGSTLPKTDWVKLGEVARLLRFQTRDGVRVLHDPKWHVMVNRPKLSVLRFIESGDLIAQCNITPLPPRAPNKDVTLEVLQANIKENLGTAFGQLHEASEKTNQANDLRFLRVVASGAVSELPIHWIYYVISHPNGQRASVVFTMESRLIERFAGADELLLSALELVEPEKAATAAKPKGTISK